MPLQSFWVLQVRFMNGNVVEHGRTEKVKKCYQQI